MDPSSSFSAVRERYINNRASFAKDSRGRGASTGSVERDDRGGLYIETAEEDNNNKQHLDIDIAYFD